MAEAKRRLRPGQESLELDVPGMPAPGRPGVTTGKRSALLWHVLTSVYARLGFDALDDAAFQQLVLARIIEPTSKADSLRVLDEIGVEHASLRTMFRSLGRAATGGYRDQIATACFTRAAASGDVSLCLYDVTTLYFEAENEDELRQGRLLELRRGRRYADIGITRRSAGSIRRSSSGCSWTAKASRWRSAAGRATPQRPRRCCRSSGSSRPATT